MSLFANTLNQMHIMAARVHDGVEARVQPIYIMASRRLPV
jgi:hypothetical protein